MDHPDVWRKGEDECAKIQKLPSPLRGTVAGICTPDLDTVGRSNGDLSRFVRCTFPRRPP